MSRLSDPRIRILPPQIANQIAAGEVVERPASVVKELLENSLDAGATAIDVELEQGGVRLIRIRDDGHGIHREDLMLALSPHATSKIVSAEDLEGVTSLGFRGEALASIASVSRLQLASRHNEEANGWCLAPGESQPAPAALSQGTEIEVHDLFYNMPARRKFLRSERTEFSHVEEVIRRIALSRFDLALRFSHNGKQLLRVKPVSHGIEGQRRVVDVLGNAFIENSRWLDVSAGPFRLWGWLGAGGYSRSQSDTNYFYLNGRMIRDRLASHAVRLAFGEHIPEGRFPAYLLYLELDPRMVDVNVHPTKHEVRFREARQVHDFIFWAVRSTLAEGETELSTPQHVDAERRIDTEPQAERYRTPLRRAVAESGATYHSTAVTRSSKVADEARLGRVIAQLHSGYLVAERGETTLFIDLRRMLQELTLSRLSGRDGDQLLIAQPLLIPESLELGAAEADLWRESAGVLAQFGFETGWLGERLLVLRKVPTVVRKGAISALLVALGAWLERHREDRESGREAMFSLLAQYAQPEPLTPFSLAELNSMLNEYAELVPEASTRAWRELQSADWPRLFELLP